MLAPLWANAAQIDTFKYGKEDYVMVTFCFQSSPSKNQETAFRPHIDMLPVGTYIFPREAYKQITKKFLGYIARQEEPTIGS